jgi:HK97 family phage portal protein
VHQRFATLARLFRNDATPGVVLSHPGKLGAEASKNLRESWDALFGGSSNARRTAVLEEGMKIERISMTAEDSQFLETRKFARSEIAGAFRVPPHLIGDLDRATFSNIEHMGIDFVTHCIRPWLVRWEQSLSRALVTAPKIVLADEPTANLDSKTGEDIIDLMKEMNATEKTTFIFSTHDNKVLSHARHVVHIADGKIAQPAGAH